MNSNNQFNKPLDLNQQKKKIIDSFDFGVPKKPEDMDAERILNTYFRSKTAHELSKDLPENTLTNKNLSLYHNALQEYNYNGGEINKYNIENPNLIKSDFIEPGDPNEGWKVHLNVTSESVQYVSEYLIKNGYNHKYLSGGDIEDGKIFTIYIGSFGLTQDCSDTIASALQAYLSKPKETAEIEFARGVIGRFCSQKREFNQYGSSGLSHLMDDARKYYGRMLQNKREGKDEENSKIRAILELNAFKKLKEKFGDYFFNEKVASVHEITKNF